MYNTTNSYMKCVIHIYHFDWNSRQPNHQRKKETSTLGELIKFFGQQVNSRIQFLFHHLFVSHQFKMVFESPLNLCTYYPCCIHSWFIYACKIWRITQENFHLFFKSVLFPTSNDDIVPISMIQKEEEFGSKSLLIIPGIHSIDFTVNLGNTAHDFDNGDVGQGISLWLHQGSTKLVLSFTKFLYWGIKRDHYHLSLTWLDDQVEWYRSQTLYYGSYCWL